MTTTTGAAPGPMPDQGRPDPTHATNEAIERASKAERDYVIGQLEVLRVRLDGMDEATKVLHETVTRTPTDIQQAVGHLHDLHTVKFESIQTQFKERDTRQERESRDNKVAVEAAFAAQKEAAAAQDKSNREAIDKSERSTAETIKTNQELSRSTTDTLTKNLDEVKLAVSRLESLKQGGREAISTAQALLGLVLALLTIGAVLAAAGVFSK